MYPLGVCLLALMLAALLHSVGTVCEERQDERSPARSPARSAPAPRRVPRLQPRECAMDLLTLECGCVEKVGHRNCFDKLRRLDGAALVMSSSRFKVQEAGQRQSSPLLFSMLKSMRVKSNHADRFNITYRIAGDGSNDLYC